MALYSPSLLIMVCNPALSFRNQMLVIMSPHSLYHYHAEWLLMTKPWINAEGSTAKVIQAAMLLLHPTTPASCSGTAVNQQISAWAHTKKWEAPAGLSFKSVLTVFRAEVQTFYFTLPSPLPRQFETLPWISGPFSSCACSLCPALSWHHGPIAKSVRIMCLSLLQSYSYLSPL